MTSSLPPTLLQRTREQHFLPVEDAWRIALAWREPLQGHVLLETEGDTVHKSYGWVRFEPHWIQSNNESLTSAARAAALAWFALSACPGYSGRENPVFWKCVFSEMAHRRVQPEVDADSRVGERDLYASLHAGSQSVIDAYGFFDRDGAEFPRFRLPLQRYSSSVRLFCGLPGEQLQPEDTTRLQQIMDQLEPWMNRDCAVRRPVVALDKLNLAHFAGEDVVPEVSKKCPQVALLQLLSDSHNARPATAMWPVPTFTIESLDIEGEITADNAAKVHQLLHQLNQHDVDIKLKFSGGDQRIDRGVLAAVVHCVLPLPGAIHRAKTTSLDLSQLDRASLPAFLSALPLTTSVQTIHLSHWELANELEERDVAWLAYAIFHPDTAASTWKSVTLSETALTDSRIAILQAMARGNNVAALLLPRGKALTHYRSTLGYYRATLTRGSGVYDRPIRRLLGTLSKRFKATRLLTTSDAYTTVEVCSVTTDDPTQWDEWVPAVVPGYGLGWIRSADIASVEKRQLCEAALTALCMDHTTVGSVSGRSLSTVFQLIGQRLVHLEMNCRCYGLSSADLRQALNHCPSLESLAAPYKAALWSDTTVSSLLPRLRELQLHCDFTQDETLSLTHLPSSLHVLRIEAHGVDRENSARWSSVVQQLLSRPSNLRIIHWQAGLCESFHPTPYIDTRAGTERQLDALGIPAQQRCIAESSLPASCAAAFLSVAHARQLNLEVAKIIAAFAGAHTPRSIVLKPQACEIPEDRLRPVRLL